MRPGCGLCGELVTSPHWCVKAYWERHNRLCKENEEYRQAVHEQVMYEEQCLLEEIAAHGEPAPQGIVDLAEWGNWAWAQENKMSTEGIDIGAVKRALSCISKLGVHERRELRAVYVTKCDAARLAIRNGQTTPGQSKGGRPRNFPVFSSAELAYLELARTQRRVA